jgi:hypothetical protein
MNSDPASARYYVVRNGQATGPYSAADMMGQFNAGAIAADTLVCEEGGSAWVPMRDLAPLLRSVLPPAAPSGYAPVPPRPAPVQQVVIVNNGGDNMKPLRIGTILAAIILFFVPWLEVKCAGNRLMYQTGVDAVLNRVSPDDNLEQMSKMGNGPKKDFSSKDLGKDSNYSILAAVALCAAVIAFGTALGQSSRRLSGVFAAVALGCLGAQAIVGFPFKSAVTKQLDEMKDKTMARGKTGEPNPGEEMAKAMMGGNMGMAIDYSPWFYAELGLLGLAALMGLSGGTSQKGR